MTVKIEICVRRGVRARTCALEDREFLRQVRGSSTMWGRGGGQREGRGCVCVLIT